MNELLRWTARIAGLTGAALCAASVLLRVSGEFVVGRFQVGTLLQGGIAAMVLGCLAYLAVLADGSRER